MNLFRELFVRESPAEVDVRSAVVHVDAADERHPTADDRNRTQVLVVDFRNREVVWDGPVRQEGHHLLMESVEGSSTFKEPYKIFCNYESVAVNEHHNPL